MNQLIQSIANIAPTIATALGGPLAGMAISVVGKALGIIDPNAENVAAAVQSSDPDIQLKLKQAENDFVVQLKQLDISLADIDEKNVESARNREIQVRDNVPSHLAYGTSIITFIYILGITFLPLSIAKDTLMFILGYLLSNLVNIYSYYYGSMHNIKRELS